MRNPRKSLKKLRKKDTFKNLMRIIDEPMILAQDRWVKRLNETMKKRQDTKSEVPDEAFWGVFFFFL